MIYLQEMILMFAIFWWFLTSRFTENSDIDIAII